MAIVAKDAKYKTISPFDLTSGDNPGAVISQPLLNGINYDEWALNFRMALSSRKKFGFINGAITKPASDSPELEDWIANNHLIVGWIKLTIEPKLRSSISTREVARDMWESLRKRFSVKSGARLQQLRGALGTCKQSGSSVDDYFGRLTKLWDGIAECMNPKKCSCGKCECDLNTAREKEDEVLKTHDFLAGLDDVHSVIRSQICAITPLPDLDSVYQTIVQNETLNNGSSKEVELMSFASQLSLSNHSSRNTPPTTRTNRDTSRVCTVCSRSGHEAAACFKVVGFPDWWEDRSRSKNNSRGKGRGTVHKANVAQVTNSEEPAVIQANMIKVTEADRQGLSGFSEDQWKTIQRIFGANQTADRLSGKNNEIVWILDTGATHHMTGKIELLQDLREIAPVYVKLPAKEDVLSTQQGTVYLTPNLSLKNVYFVPGFHTNLISVGQLVTDEFLVAQMTDKLLLLQDRRTRMLIGAGDRESEGLYQFRGIETVASNQTSVSKDGVIWHMRLGHASHRALDKIPEIRVNYDLSLENCDICLQAKQTRLSFPVSSSNAKEVFDLVHCDLWGPYQTPALCGSRYFLTIVDDCSRAVWLYLLPDKSVVSYHLRNYLTMIERQFQKKVKVIRSDNGTEFLCMTKFFQEQGIIHETSCIHTPQQNGRVERKHRHILEVARALRFQGNFPIEYWGDCVLTASYLINRTPTEVLHGKTPFEILYGHPPSYKHLRVLGCLAFAHNTHHKGDKFESRSRRCVFVGYPYGKKGWKLYDLDQQIFFVSRDVIFQEDTFPFSVNEISNEVDSQLLEPPSIEIIEPSLPSSSEATSSEPLIVENNVNEAPHDDVVVNEAPHDDVVVTKELGVGKRVVKPPNYLSDYIVGTATISPLSSTTPSAPQLSSGTNHPISAYLSSKRFSSQYCSYIVALTNAVEPRSFKEAMLHDEWKVAMKSEVESLEENRTWDLQELPPDKKVIGSQWVYKIKLLADGSLERYKARLVALGNHQVEGLNYHETFAPVAKITTVRLILDIAAKRNYEVHQMDVHNAFLHGDLDEEIYMKPPPGFSIPGDNRVCRLRKSLYGLKQSPRCWFAKLADALQTYGFKQTRSDYSLFVFNHGGVSLQILVYVDDLIISGNSPSAIQEFKNYLSQCFKMKDLGHAKYFLGIEIARSPAGIYICQRKYAIDIVTEAGLLGCKPAGFPLDQNHKLALADGPLLTEPEQYRRLVGRLVYLSSTRPDLSYAIHILSQFMQQPKLEHWEAALKVVRYLKGTLGQGILLRADSPLQLTAWCDADWASCPLSRKSLTGWIVRMGESPISWKTKKQKTVSCSSAEAEYRAMAAACKELKWLKSLLFELGISHDQPIPLHCDNQAALHISANPVFHERTKYIEIDCHFVRDCITDGMINAGYISTKDQLADILTKALGRKEFQEFIFKLGIQNLHAPT